MVLHVFERNFFNRKQFLLYFWMFFVMAITFIRANDYQTRAVEYVCTDPKRDFDLYNNSLLTSQSPARTGQYYDQNGCWFTYRGGESIAPNVLKPKTDTFYCHNYKCSNNSFVTKNQQKDHHHNHSEHGSAYESVCFKKVSMPLRLECVCSAHNQTQFYLTTRPA